MKLYKEELLIDSTGGKVTYSDITESVKAAIENSGITSGTCTVLTAHTTCSVFFEEFAHDIAENGDEFLQIDLNNALEKIIPNHDNAETYVYPGEAHYQAVESWPNAAEYLPGGDRSALWNGDAHLKSTLLGASEVFEVDEGKLAVGSTGYIYFADFDRTRPRTRKCKVIIMGI